MGMNYYLRKKINWDRSNPLPSTLGTGDYNYHWDNAEPTELVNGFVWRNKYYATVEALNDEFYQEIHIGKSSCGWRFGLCVYPDINPRFKDDPLTPLKNKVWLEEPIKSLDDWIVLFNNPNNKIFDEEGEEISPQNMIDIITKRKGDIEAHPDGWIKDRHGNTYYRAINGLYVHDETRHPFGHPQYNTIMPPDCTYDLILSGNDVEAGSIFS